MQSDRSRFSSWKKQVWVRVGRGNAGWEPGGRGQHGERQKAINKKGCRASRRTDSPTLKPVAIPRCEGSRGRVAGGAMGRRWRCFDLDELTWCGRFRSDSPPRLFRGASLNRQTGRGRRCDEGDEDGKEKGGRGVDGRVGATLGALENTSWSPRQWNERAGFWGGSGLLLLVARGCEPEVEGGRGGGRAGSVNVRKCGALQR